MTNDIKLARITTECECHDPHHVMQFCLFSDGEDPELYVSVQLNQHRSFWARVWVALCYIWGRRSKFGYGHWDEGTISPDSAKELRQMIEEFISKRDISGVS